MSLIHKKWKVHELLKIPKRKPEELLILFSGNKKRKVTEEFQKNKMFEEK